MRFLKGKSCDLQHYFYTKCITLFFFKSRILKVEIKRRKIMSRVAEQTLNYTIRFANALFADTAEFLKYLEEHSKDAKEYEVIKSLYEAYANKSDDVYMVPVKDIAINDLKQEFEKLGIPNIQNTIPDKDLNFFIVRKDDLALVNYAIEKTMERGRVINEVNFGVMAKDNLQNEDGRPLYSYKGLDEIQKKGILEEAKNRGFTISSQYHENSKTYDIYFKEKDRDKVRDAYSHIRTMELGKTGERYVNEMERSLDNMRHILKESSRPLKVGEERDFYIVSPNNIHRNIHVQDQEFEHLSEAPNRKRVLRHFEGKGKELERQLYREIATMKNPIIIPKKEWEETRNDPEKRKTLIREKQESYRYSSYEDRQMAQKERDLRMLIEQKMSLDNGDQIENVSSFYNGEVGIHEFFSHEIVNRTHEEEIDQDVQDNEKRFNLESLKESEREQLREYGESILATYKDLAEPEQYYPDREMVMNSLDELLKNAQAQQIDHEVTKSIEEELFR